MSPSETATPAGALLDIVLRRQGQPAPTDATAECAVTNFLTHITELDAKHNRGKRLTEDQLAEQVFRRCPTFKDDRGQTGYLRYHLRAALDELTYFNHQMRQQNNGLITFEALSTCRYIILDYLFDLREILNFLQQNVSGWTFFEGGKNPGVNSWEVYRLARQMAFYSTCAGAKPLLDHKSAQIASIFVLRQAMELRFERLVAVYPTDQKGMPPKLKHGFHHDFIVRNPQYFEVRGFQIKKLRHLYDWCSGVVHQARQPYAWQVAMALRRAGDLMQPREESSGKQWSVFNAVRITDVEAMQDAYEKHFLATYDHGTWKFARTRPEALVLDWQANMATTSADYRPALSRPNLYRRIKMRARRLIRALR